jgi:hypothetical protein
VPSKGVEGSVNRQERKQLLQCVTCYFVKHEPQEMLKYRGRLLPSLQIVTKIRQFRQIVLYIF